MRLTSAIVYFPSFFVTLRPLCVQSGRLPRRSISVWKSFKAFLFTSRPVDFVPVRLFAARHPSCSQCKFSLDVLYRLESVLELGKTPASSTLAMRHLARQRVVVAIVVQLQAWALVSLDLQVGRVALYHRLSPELLSPLHRL